MNRTSSAEPQSSLSPGLGESQNTILELLLRGGEATLADLEASVDLAIETLRDHLKALGAKGLVERAGVRREGPGRPQVVYRLSSAGRSLFPGAKVSSCASWRHSWSSPEIRSSWSASLKPGSSASGRCYCDTSPISKGQSA